MDAAEAIRTLADKGPGTYGRVYAAEAALVRELDAARATIAEQVECIDRQADLIVDLREEIERLRDELDKVKGHRAELSERCYRKDLELDELRDRHDPRR